MREYPIVDLTPGLVAGVQVELPGVAQRHCEGYFVWQANTLTATAKTRKMTGGILKAYPYQPVFTQMETHQDVEMFYFLQGIALMPFADVKDGQVDLDSIQIVRVYAGTQLLIVAGKAHFVAVAEGETPVLAVVQSPPMPAPRVNLPEPIAGI